MLNKKFLILISICFVMGVGYMGFFNTSANAESWKDVLKKAEEDKQRAGSSAWRIYNVEKSAYETIQRIEKTEEEWRTLLNDQEYYIAFEEGTERAFTGALNDNKRKGVYRSKASGIDVFHSDHKFDSGTGWPSYWRPVDPANILLKKDTSLFAERIEVIEVGSGAHLGHVFPDGPPPTGLRYCINSDALDFVEGVEFKQK